MLTSDTAQPLPENPNENGPLDYPITDDEINSASYSLKPGKAVGADGVSNEMISCLLEYDSKIFHTFLMLLSRNAIQSIVGLFPLLIRFTKRAQKLTQKIIEVYRFCLALGNFF